MTTIRDLFQQAQLAEAAYADFGAAIGNQGNLEIVLNIANKEVYGGTFSEEQAGLLKRIDSTCFRSW